MALSPLNQRRWRNFKANRRAYWSLILMALLYGLSLCAELLANDRPLLVKYQGSYYTPFLSFYSEQTFGGDLRTEAKYTFPEVQCLIVSGGAEACWDDPDAVMAEARDKGTAYRPWLDGLGANPLPLQHHRQHRWRGARPDHRAELAGHR